MRKDEIKLIDLFPGDCGQHSALNFSLQPEVANRENLKWILDNLGSSILNFMFDSKPDGIIISLVLREINVYTIRMKAEAREMVSNLDDNN